MTNYTWIGFIGMIFLNICYLPQFIRTIKTKKVKDVSTTYYLCLFCGLTMYLIYSIINRDIVYFISNVSSLTQTTIMLFLIRKYRVTKK